MCATFAMPLPSTSAVSSSFRNMHAVVWVQRKPTLHLALLTDKHQTDLLRRARARVLQPQHHCHRRCLRLYRPTHQTTPLHGCIRKRSGLPARTLKCKLCHHYCRGFLTHFYTAVVGRTTICASTNSGLLCAGCRTKPSSLDSISRTMLRTGRLPISGCMTP